MNILYYVMVQL